MPVRLRCSFSSSARSFSASFLGSEAMRPSASIVSSACMRLMRLRIVTQLVSMPPSQRWLTNGIPARAASVSTASWACFFVPMNF